MRNGPSKIAEARRASRLVGDDDSAPASPMASDNINSSISPVIRSPLSVEIRLNLWLVVDLPAPVVQLDRATASGAVGCGFEPRRAHSL